MKYLVFSLLAFCGSLHADAPFCFDDGDALHCGNQTGSSVIPAPLVGKVSVFAAGTGPTGCAVDDIGQHCWGDIQLDPRRYDRIQQTAYAPSFTCYLQDGRVYCFGITVPRLEGVLAISAYKDSLCALGKDRLECYGKTYASIPVTDLGFTRIRYTPEALTAVGPKGTFAWVKGAWTPWAAVPGEGKPGLVSDDFGYCYREKEENRCFSPEGKALAGVPGPEFKPLSSLEGRITFASAKEVKWFYGGKNENPFANEPRTFAFEGVTHGVSGGIMEVIQNGRRIRLDYAGRPVVLPLPEARPRLLDVGRIAGSYPEKHRVCGLYGDELVCAEGSTAYYGWKALTEKVPGLKDYSNGCKLFPDRIDCDGKIVGEEVFPEIASVRQIKMNQAYRPFELCALYPDRARCFHRVKNCTLDFALEPGAKLTQTSSGEAILFGTQGTRAIGFESKDSCEPMNREVSARNYDQVMGDYAVREGKYYRLFSGNEFFAGGYKLPYRMQPDFPRGLPFLKSQLEPEYRDYVDTIARFLAGVTGPGPLPLEDEKPLVPTLFATMLVAPYLEAVGGSTNSLTHFALSQAWQLYAIRWVKDFRRFTGMHYVSMWRMAAEFLLQSAYSKGKSLPDEPSVERLKNAAWEVHRQGALGMSEAAQIAGFRERIVQLRKSFEECRGLFERNPATKVQLAGDELALWYLEGV